jgi:predicted peptidase
VKEVIPEADGWSLVPEQFPDKYFYVRSFTVACEAAPELGFTMADIGETTAGAADLFTLREAENGRIKAWVYRPETEVPLPVVVVFHGYGDTANLLTYRTAVDWAEPEHQAARPCIVIAPTIEDGLYVSDNVRGKVFAQVLAWIDEMAAAGAADPDRIYLMGNSFGGMSSLEFTECYPDRVAAVLSLCPAVGYSGTAVQNLPAMKDVPVWFAHAEHDNTIPAADSETCLNTLLEAGSTTAKRTVYTDEEMNAAGGSPSPDSTYSYHHVELAVMEDDTYMEWLFAQHRE